MFNSITRVSTINTYIADILYFIKNVLVMTDLDIDVKKIPATKLSALQIEKARNILNQLKSQDLSKAQCVDLCNRYYTVIPHNFGRNLPPLITDTEPHVKKLNVLEHIKDVMALLRSPQSESSVGQIEALYGKICAELPQGSSPNSRTSQSPITGFFNPSPNGTLQSSGLGLPTLGDFTMTSSTIETKPHVVPITTTPAEVKGRPGVDSHCTLTGVSFNLNVPR